MEEEFIVVRRKKKKGKYCHDVHKQITVEQNTVPCIVDSENVITRINTCKRELEESDFWLTFKETVTRSLEAVSSCSVDISSLEAVSSCSVDTSSLEAVSSCSVDTSSLEAVSSCSFDTSSLEAVSSCSVDTSSLEAVSSSFDTSSLEAVSSCSFDTSSLEAVSSCSVDTSSLEAVPSCSVDSIVCYGLGNFSSCINGKYQLSLFLLLINYLKVAPFRCFCYDPVFTSTECDILKGFGLSCLEFNEEGKRKVDKPTVFYMPHCGKPLYNNLLWSNWGIPLSNLIIIGNSFQNINERFSSKLLEEEVPYIKAIFPYMHQISIVNNFKFADIFNDTGVHVFPISLLKQAPSNMWDSADEPNYSHLDDIEIILKS